MKTPQTRHLIGLGLALLLAGCAGGGSSARTSPTAGQVSAGSTGSGPGPVAGPFDELDMTTLDRGEHTMMPSGVRVELFTDDADFLAAWAAHGKKSLPQVDFTKFAVVLVVDEDAGRLGHSVEVVRARQEMNGGGLMLTVRRFRVADFKVAATGTSRPFHFAIVRTPRLADRVEVEWQQALDYETLVAGNQSALGAGDPTWTGARRVFRDGTDFAAWWQLHQPGTRAPAVDFSTQMIVAVHARYYSSFGHNVQVRQLIEDPARGALRIVDEVTGYRGGAAPPQMTETPFIMVRAQRAAGTLRVEQTRDLQPVAVDQGQTSLWTGGDDVLVIRDQATLDAEWAARIGGRPPVIDFTADELILAFSRAAQSGGASVHVAGAWLSEDGELGVRVTTAHFSFGGGAGGLQSRWQAAVVERSHGPQRIEVVDVTPAP